MNCSPAQAPNSPECVKLPSPAEVLRKPQQESCHAQAVDDGGQGNDKGEGAEIEIHGGAS